MFVLFFEDTLTLEYMNMETIRESTEHRVPR